MKLWIIMRRPADDGSLPPPAACPHAGCDGRRFRLHQQHVRKSIRPIPLASGTGNRRTGGSIDRPAVAARRYRCLACGRSFRVYPRDVDRGSTPLPVKRFAAALCRLGLTVREASAMLAKLGTPLGKSQVHACARRLVAGGLRHPGAAPIIRCLRPPEPGRAHATVVVNGHRLPIRTTVDGDGRPALVIDGIDARTSLAEREWVGEVMRAMGVDVVVEGETACGWADVAAGGGCLPLCPPHAVTSAKPACAGSCDPARTALPAGEGGLRLRCREINRRATRAPRATRIPRATLAGQRRRRRHIALDPQPGGIPMPAGRRRARGGRGGATWRARLAPLPAYIVPPFTVPAPNGRVATSIGAYEGKAHDTSTA